MAFNWKEYLNLAQFLQRQTGKGLTQEAAFRCAVSRAYYAAFCYARNYARDRQRFSPTSKPDDHRLVREHFRDKGMAKIAQNLDKLRQWRNNCDYTDTVPNVSILVTSAISKAQEIFSMLP
ncbi:HEPN domain-containing protein [bacterium]|nr:HEPN domain-containing protein [bacterium]MBU1614051.1 HEPN domain-containing protein [bacterium]